MSDYGAGLRDPLFFMGVVEDIVDPRSEGRARVRAFGIHGTNKDIPTDELPWALIVKGDYDPNGTPGLGLPAVNSWVFGVFLDGRGAQQPMILGLIPTQPTQITDPATDGYGKIPNRNGELLSRGAAPEDIGQPQNDRLSRGENIDETYVVNQESNKIEDVQFAGDEERTWSEPTAAYDAQYPFNRVFKSGRHSIELDDTPGHERIMIYHNEGSYIQIDSRGTVTNKSTSDQFDVIDKNSHVVIGGAGSGFSTVTINGNAYVKVNGNKTEEITGDLQTLVHGNHLHSVGNQYTMVAGVQAQMRAADLKLEANVGTMSIKAGKEMQVSSGEGLYVKSDKVWLEALSTLNILGDQTFLKGTSEIDIFGADIAIKGTEAFNIKGDAELILGSDGNVHVRGQTVYIDDYVSMANGGASSPDDAAEAEESKEASAIEAPEPVVQNTSIMPVTETGSMDSSGLASQDDESETQSSAQIYDSKTPQTSVTKTALSPLLDLINEVESKVYGYDSIYGEIPTSLHPVKAITKMTIQEILDWQESIDAVVGSEAVGRYQIIEDTLRNTNNNDANSPKGTPLYTRAGLSASDLFTPENQDKLAIALIEGRGLNRYMEGKLSLENFANNLAHEWAGLPLITGPNAGKSAYDGDGLNEAAPNMVQKFISVLNDIKIRQAISSGGLE